MYKLFSVNYKENQERYHELETGEYLRCFLLPDRGRTVAVFKSRNRFLNDCISDFKNGNIYNEVVKA
jgi:hypothetical protein